MKSSPTVQLLMHGTQSRGRWQVGASCKHGGVLHKQRRTGSAGNCAQGSAALQHSLHDPHLTQAAGLLCVPPQPAGQGDQDPAATQLKSRLGHTSCELMHMRSVAGLGPGHSESVTLELL